MRQRREMMDRTAIYKEILELMNSHADILVGDHQLDIRDKLVNRIAVQKIINEFGIDLPKDSTAGYCKISEHEAIGLYGEKYNRTISWSDDGIQPEDERLYVISFPTGAYIFGRDYPTKTFNGFFNELKSYGPKYLDTTNHNLYFTHDKAKEVHENFKEIYKKYNLLVDEELKEQKIESLKKELEKLEEC
jgi:hypothetical protein